MATESAKAPAHGDALPHHDEVSALPLLQRRWVQNVLPWITSLTVHAGMFVLAAAMVVVVVNQTPPPLRQEQIVIPEAAAMVRDPGTVPNLGNADEVERQLTVPEPDSGGQSSAGALGSMLDASSGAVEKFAIADGPASGAGNLGRELGMGKYGHGSGNGPAQIGPPRGGGGVGPRSAIFEKSGNAKHIVFVCDASGSMTNKFASLKDQLTRAFSRLRVPQTYDIIFFQDGRAVAFSRNALHQDSMPLATQETHRNASAFLENMTVGQTSDPMEALRLAFARKPDLVYLLTDGDFPDNNAVLANVRSLNRPDAEGRKAKVNTIAFVGKSDADTEYKQTLRRIAEENNGQFKQVAEEDLDDQ